MSVITALSHWGTRPSFGSLLGRASFAVGAILVVCVGLGVLAWLAASAGLGLATPPKRNPFGMTLRDATPGTAGLGGFILLAQAQFYSALTFAVQAMKSGEAAATSLATVGFLYGVFHAAGPGHGKGVITAYILAGKRSVLRGWGLCLAAALLQATIAVVLVSVLAVLLNVTAASINSAARVIEAVSFAAIAAFGAALVWWKAGELCSTVANARTGLAPCEEVRLLSPKDRGGSRDWRELATVILAAGIRPCSGAIILLVFALSQNLFGAGVLGALAMAGGTALTTGLLATLAVSAKATLLRMAGHNPRGLVAIATVELLAAAFVLTLGCIFLTGLATDSMPSILD